MQQRVQQLEQVIQDLVSQDQMINKWNVLQTYVLVAAELERVSQAAFDLQEDNTRLANTCQQLQDICKHQEDQLNFLNSQQLEIRAEHDRNVQYVNDLLKQNEILCDSLASFKMKPTASSLHATKGNEKHTDGQINLLLGVNAKLEDENQTQQQLIIELKRENYEISQQLNECRNEIDAVMKDMKDCEEMYRQNLKKQQDQIQALEQNKNNSVQEISWSQKKIDEVIKCNEQLQNMMSLTKQEVKDLQDQLNQEKVKLVDQTKQRKISDLKADEYRKELDQMRLKVSQFNQEKVNMVQANEQLRKEFNEYSAKTNSELNIKTQESVYLSKQIEQLKKQLCTEQALQAQEQNRLNLEIQKSKEVIKIQNQRLSELEPQFISINSEKESLQLKVKLLNTKAVENEQLLNTVSQLRQDNNKMKQVVIDLTDSINQQKSVFHNQQKELLSLQEQLAQYQEQVTLSNTYQKQVAELQIMIDDQRYELQGAQEEIYKITSWNKQLHAQVEDLRHRNHQLNQLLSERENHHPIYQAPPERKLSPYNYNNRMY